MDAAPEMRDHSQTMGSAEPFRRAIREHVEFGAHVAQQNSRAHTDAELHPIREVPHWDWPD